MLNATDELVARVALSIGVLCFGGSLILQVPLLHDRSTIAVVSLISRYFNNVLFTSLDQDTYLICCGFRLYNRKSCLTVVDLILSPHLLWVLPTYDPFITMVMDWNNIHLLQQQKAVETERALWDLIFESSKPGKLHSYMRKLRAKTSRQEWQHYQSNCMLLPEKMATAVPIHDHPAYTVIVLQNGTNNNTIPVQHENLIQMAVTWADTAAPKLLPFNRDEFQSSIHKTSSLDHIYVIPSGYSFACILCVDQCIYYLIGTHPTPENIGQTRWQHCPIPDQSCAYVLLNPERQHMFMLQFCFIGEPLPFSPLFTSIDTQLRMNRTMQACTSIHKNRGVDLMNPWYKHDTLFLQECQANGMHMMIFYRDCTCYIFTSHHHSG